MPRGRDYQERAAHNDASRSTADHHQEPWSGEELETLTELWDGTEETLADLAEILGRTIEACRQRYYETRKGLGAGSKRTVTHTVTTTTTTASYEEWTDNPEWYR